MRQHIRNLLVWASLLLFAATAASWARSYQWTDTVYLHRDAQRRRAVAVSSGSGCLTASDISVAPGSMIQLGLGPWFQSQRGHPPNEIQLPWRGGLGFKYYHDPGPGLTIDILRVWYGWLLVLSGIAPAAWLCSARRDRKRAAANLCHHCGYDLRATPTRCPECGGVAPSDKMETTREDAVLKE